MVIQRWQTVLLFVSVVLMGCFSFASLGQIQTQDITYNFTALGFSPEGQATGAVAPESIGTWYLMAVSLLSALIPLIAIFVLRQERLQKNLCLLSMLLVVCVTGVAAVLGYNTFAGAEIEWSALVCAPFVALIAEVMAYQRICSDYRAIHSSDRLR